LSQERTGCIILDIWDISTRPGTAYFKILILYMLNKQQPEESYLEFKKDFSNFFSI